MSASKQKAKWGSHSHFTRESLLKRDIRSAATRSAKKGIKPTLAKLKCLEPESGGESASAQTKGERDV